MRSPTTALIWEIWQRNRRTVGLVFAFILVGSLFNELIPNSFRATAAGRERLLTLNSMLMTGSFLLVVGVFNYTEFNPQREWTGFPYRLFALPVSTLRLVVLPMLLGVVSLELTFLAWWKLVFGPGELVMPEWIAALLGAYMVFYQTILWSLAGFRILRMIVLGLAGTSMVGVGCLPMFGKIIPSVWLSETVLIALLTTAAIVAFATAWGVVARQRTGGGRRGNWLRMVMERALDLLPRRRKAFNSPAAAQLWYEWRRTGLLLPGAIAALLILVIGPLSWGMRDEELTVPWILFWTLLLPVALAAAMSKGFSKPDFWSRDLSLPTFLAVRPVKTGEMVVVKMKVAAFSAALAWMLVLVFFCLWLPLWANPTAVAEMRVGYWMVYDHTLYPQFVIAALTIIAGMLLTWKFLVGGLRVGLSGSRKMFNGFAAAYVAAGILGVMSLVILLNNDTVFREWIHEDPNRLLSYFEWAVAVAIIAKFWLAAYWWRRIANQYVLKYLLLWCGATSLLIALAILLWANGTLSLMLMEIGDFWPVDVYRLKRFLILLALLMIPLARTGLAPSSLVKNRHG